ncbi:uncharacterized protein [Cicer arietinum]|uniref:Uncharacterized protein LOC105851955 n=1 Tax=Cicer arietinum TaxID=3827 RepID=A0A1S3E3X1_CICAR|nr:uncharacterized protein LOC105851955 [Cicer arietinum]
MKANGEVMIEVVIIEKILRTLTQRYNHIVVAIEESNYLDKMKLEDLQSSLEAHELRVKERDEAHTYTGTTNSGCLTHMTDHKDWFVSIDEKVKSEIRFVDNSKVTAEGVGKISKKIWQRIVHI